MALPQTPPRIRPISDLRTHLADIEEDALTGPVTLVRNNKPVLLVFNYDSYFSEREWERHKEKLREAELSMAYGSQSRVSHKDMKARMADLAEELDRMFPSSAVSDAKLYTLEEAKALLAQDREFLNGVTGDARA